MNYTATLLPGLSVWLPACDKCGALVLNTSKHDEWHASLTGEATS